MQITYFVHSVVPAAFQAEVQYNGVSTLATISGLIVELVSEDGSMSRTIKVPPQFVEEATALYIKDSKIITTDTQG